MNFIIAHTLSKVYNALYFYSKIYFIGKESRSIVDIFP